MHQPRSTSWILAVAAVALAAAFLAPSALAQTVTNPVEGEYDEIYVLTGRVVDSNGEPAAGAILDVDVEQRDVEAAPFPVRANCFGDFIATFNIRYIDATGRAIVRLRGADGGVPAQEQTVRLDSFFRRSDLVLQTEAPWKKECAEDRSSAWPGRLSVAGRILNRTESYEIDGTRYDAKPYVGRVEVWYVNPEGFRFCPPTLQGVGCENLATDERGDFRYSFTFPDPTPAEGVMQIVVDGKTYNATVDPVGRIAFHHVELSGQGAPVRGMPFPGVGAMTFAFLAAVALRSVLGRDPR